MKEQFTPMEIQLIRSSLATKTDDEIAELLERSVDDVREMINEITDGGADERSKDVAVYIEEKKKAKINQKLPRMNIRKKELKHSRVDARKKEIEKVNNDWVKRKQENRYREDRKVFKTRVVDSSDLISVKLDDKTYAFVRKEKTEKETKAAIELAIFNYEKTKNKRLLIKEE